LSSRVVVLGCGLGGLVTSDNVSKQIGNRGTVIIVEPRERIPFPPALPWLTFGFREPEKIQRSLKGLSKRQNVRMVPGKVEKIDLSGRSVKTGSDEIHYDKLVVSLGAELGLDGVPGLNEYSHTFYTLDGAMKLRKALEVYQGGKIIVGVCGTPFKCPAAPYEMALLLEEQMKHAKKSSEIHIVTPESQPVPAAGSVIGKQVERLLENHGIKYHPKAKPTKIERNKVTMEGGMQLDYDLLITVPPHRVPNVAVEAGLAEASGWIPVNPQTLATKFPDVYAVGDVASIETPHGHVPFLPKAGVFAQGQAEVVANNIAFLLTGKGQMKQWDGTGACHLQVSKSECAYLQGSFLSNPPRLEFHPPSRKWYLDKVWREKNWLA
jgi:sulfide:quinone oxidoreductase